MNIEHPNFWYCYSEKVSNTHLVVGNALLSDFSSYVRTVCFYVVSFCMTVKITEENKF